jgi:hypothetical protein
MYIEVSIGNRLSDNFPIQNGLKQGNYLTPIFFFNFALECVIGNVQGKQVGLELSGTHRLLAYADNLKSTGR